MPRQPQGQEVSAELHQQLNALHQQLAAQVVHMADTPAELVRPYGDTLAAANVGDRAGAVEACRAAVKARTAGLVPQVGAWQARALPPRPPAGLPHRDLLLLLRGHRHGARP